MVFEGFRVVLACFEGSFGVVVQLCSVSRVVFTFSALRRFPQS